MTSAVKVMRQVAAPITGTPGSARAPLFVPPPLPLDEAERQRAVDRLQLDGTGPERDFDEVVALASRLCGTPIALFTLLSNDHQWFKASVGVALQTTSRDIAFCGHTILGPDTVVVDDMTQDARFARNPLVTGDTHVRFYAGVPVASPDGQPVGTLCVLDQTPRSLSAEQQRSLEILARQIQNQLGLRQALREQLELAREKQELTDLVVHDLKSPLASITPNAHYIASVGTEDCQQPAADIIEAARRLQRMLVDVLDTSAATRGGLHPVRTTVDVATLLRAVQAGCSGRADVGIDIAADVVAVDADANLLRRVLENLIDNAVKYGGREPVQLTARRLDDATVELAVRDLGPGIPVADRERIFARGQRLEGTSADTARDSRGLGLRFCAMAVAAHGARIVVEDNEPRGTAFCVQIAAAR